MAAVAASSAIIALFLVQFFGGTQTPARFETATSARVETQTDYVLNIVFESASAEVDHDRVMRLIEAREVTRTNNNGNYRVTVSLPASSLQELQRFTDDVESLPEVRSVEVIAVQLPVRLQQ